MKYNCNRHGMAHTLMHLSWFGRSMRRIHFVHANMHVFDVGSLYMNIFRCCAVRCSVSLIPFRWFISFVLIAAYSGRLYFSILHRIILLFLFYFTFKSLRMQSLAAWITLRMHTHKHTLLQGEHKGTHAHTHAVIDHFDGFLSFFFFFSFFFARARSASNKMEDIFIGCIIDMDLNFSSIQISVFRQWWLILCRNARELRSSTPGAQQKRWTINHAKSANEFLSGSPCPIACECNLFVFFFLLYCRNYRAFARRWRCHFD